MNLIKLGLCSSEWDQTWNEDSQSNALERNGEIFPNTGSQTDDVIHENHTFKYSAGKSSPLSYCPAIDRVAKTFELLKVNTVGGEFYRFEGCNFLLLCWSLFHRSSYCSL